MKRHILVAIVSVLFVLSLGLLGVALWLGKSIFSAGLALVSALLIRVWMGTLATMQDGSRVFRRLPSLRRVRVVGFGILVIWVIWLFLAPMLLHIRRYEGMLEYLGIGSLLLIVGVALIFGSDIFDIWENRP